MQEKAKPLSSSIRYREFIKQRDVALEVILNRYLSAASQIVGMMHEQVNDLVRSLAASDKLTPLSIHSDRPIMEHKLDWIARMSAAATYDLARKLRVSSFSLAHVGEVEALGRSLGKPQRAELTSSLVTAEMAKPSPTGGPLRERIELYFQTLKADVIEALMRSMLLEDNVKDALERVRLAFPKTKWVKRPRRELKAVPMREAGSDDESFSGYGRKQPLIVTTGHVDDDAWQQMVDDYLGKNLPGPRGPQDTVEIEGEERYEWEVEQELTQDFVERVRSGQHDAAKANGIVELMWVAIVDDKTDECCLKRDGLTSQEIEDKLSGEWADDECKAKVTPAHFNCRCLMVPVSKELPESPPEDDLFEDFEQWLQS